MEQLHALLFSTYGGVPWCSAGKTLVVNQNHSSQTPFMVLRKRFQVTDNVLVNLMSRASARITIGSSVVTAPVTCNTIDWLPVKAEGTLGLSIKISIPLLYS